MNKKKLLIIFILSAVIIVVGIILLLTGNKKTITYNVSFETNGGTFIETQVINKGDQATKPKDPTKDGYLFVDWLYQNKTYDFSKEVNSDLVLTAKWSKIEADVETFVVKFDTDAGSTIANQIIEKGNKVTKPKDPTKEGYIFKGWTLNGEDFDFETAIDTNIELKATWEKEPEEEQNNNNQPNNNQNSSSNNNTSGGNSNNNNNTSGGNNNKPSPKKYTVTFNSNGGTAVSKQIVEENSKVTKPANPTRNGYIFAGWTLNGNIYNFDTPVKSNITLVATWTEKVKAKYTITFDSNGGTAVANQIVEEGNKVTQPAAPTRTGYTFAGWTLNGNAYNFNSTVTSNITLVAKWNQKSYTIRISIVDDYSPARILTVYENGTQITVNEIRYSDGTRLCSGANPNVNKNALTGETTFIVVLQDGTQVTAYVV